MVPDNQNQIVQGPEIQNMLQYHYPKPHIPYYHAPLGLWESPSRYMLVLRILPIPSAINKFKWVLFCLKTT